MKTKEFFEVRLGTPLRNAGWSWGAYDEKRKGLFLRINKDDIVDDEEGGRWAVVFREPDWRGSSGCPERLRHIELIREGADAYGVVYWTRQVGDRLKTDGFNHDTLLVLGDVVEEDATTYAQIVGEVSVDDVIGGDRSDRSVADDIEDAFSRDVTETQRRALIEARIGQGQFRDKVLSLWGRRCAVSGVTEASAIRASHIKPWKQSSDRERLDPHNGLPLVATLDALFDVGLITFDESGRLIISSLLNSTDSDALNLRGCRLGKQPSRRTAAYLAFHRQNVFRK